MCWRRRATQSIPERLGEREPAFFLNVRRSKSGEALSISGVMVLASIPPDAANRCRGRSFFSPNPHHGSETSTLGTSRRIRGQSETQDIYPTRRHVIVREIESQSDERPERDVQGVPLKLEHGDRLTARW